MVEERYCSFEISKLLREKGFNEPCRAAYTKYGKLFTTQIQQYVTNIVWECVAPTHQMAIDWLREKKNIFIIIEPHAYDYVNEKNKSYSCSLWIGDNYYQYIESRDYPSYGEAVEAILKYVLEKIIK